MAESFKDWLGRIEKEQAKAQSNVWDTWPAWPKSARSEIERVLEHNDGGQLPRITVKMLLERLRDRYGIETNGTTIRSYLRKELDRNGWKK